MNFWDASGIVALAVNEPRQAFARSILENDGGVAVWWGTSIEYASAVARRIRDGSVIADRLDELVQFIDILSMNWFEVQPNSKIKEAAQTLVHRYPLRAADSLQLAAALSLAERYTRNIGFVCFDVRLNRAAAQEGFVVLDGEGPDPTKFRGRSSVNQFGK